MKKLIPIFLFALSSLGSLSALIDQMMTPNFLGQNNNNLDIIVHNRVLVKLNGKTISVMDVKKALDMYLYDHHPEVLNSTMQKYQFYNQNWKATLQELIENELILLEAEKLKIEIPAGDVREEMKLHFGPNVVKKLEDVGITYDEAKTLTQDEIIVKNLSWYRIWSRVLQLVTPETLKHSYEEYLVKNPAQDQWIYQTLTIRGLENEVAEEAAHVAYAVLNKSKDQDLASVMQTLNDSLPKTVTVNLSDEFRLQSNELSSEYRSILERLTPLSVSEPIKQKSRSDGATVFRVFRLKEHQIGTPPSFEQLSPKLRNELIQKCSVEQRKEYFNNLRKLFCCEDITVEKIVDPSFQPFSLYSS